MTDMDSSTSARVLQALDDAMKKLEQVSREKSEPIAVVGLSCRFPGANSPEAFWQNLAEGKDAIEEIPESRWNLEAHYAPSPPTPGKMYCRHGGFLEDVRGFDASLFRVSPREAISMDPQQRILLEVTWEALERAGFNPRGLEGSSASVHIGATTQDYRELLQADRSQDAIDTYFASGNAPNALAGRISYSLGLTGPSLVIDTACSSSLVAVHLACQALRSRESDLAIAGGSNLVLSPQLQVALCQANMLSPTGRCRAFSSEADGYVRGEGCGVLVLKRLSDAVSNQDHILAQIRGSAVNQDGASAGFTVPNGPAQEAVIRRAIETSHLRPHDVDYLEAHGTGTPLGDPIEINAASRVYSESRDPNSPLLVGSVKTNVGHLEAAAGVAGLIKIVLSLQAKSLPPHLHFAEPNSDISWDKQTVRITDRTIDWAHSDKPRIAAISSFGASGTNAHAIVEEAPEPIQSTARAERNREEVFVMSADSPEALADLTKAYHDFLLDNPSVSLSDLCYTAASCRAHLRHRRALWGSSTAELRENLARAMAGEPTSGVATGSVGPNTGSQAKPEQEMTARIAGNRFVEGDTVSWDALYPKRRPLLMPTYPFQHVPYWPEIDEETKLPDILYQSDWELAEQFVGFPPSEPCHWILVASDPSKISKLSNVLSDKGEDVDTVLFGSAPNGVVHGEVLENLANTLEQAAGRKVSRILFFPEFPTGPGPATGTSLAHKAARICQQTVELFRLLSGKPGQKDTRVWLVTQNTQSCQPDRQASVSGLGLSSVWGLSRTIATEHPEIFGGLADVDGELSIATANRLVDHIQLGTAQFRVSDDQTRVPRVRHIPTDRPRKFSTSPIRGGSTYLITGGLGALGTQLARWLAQSGAEDIVLLSRRGERPETESALEAIRSLGPRVWAPPVDVTDLGQIEATVGELQRSHHPLKGVFHLAGILDDRIVSRLDTESIERVMLPKVAGAWNLHTATRDLPLDCFVLFSSLASLMGPAGQGNYAAANAFLDTLTQHRAGLELPSSVINWGPWSGSGMWDSLDSREKSNANRSGVEPLSGTEALAALDTVLRNGITNTIAARIDWAELFATNRPAFLRDWAERLPAPDTQPVETEDVPPITNLLALEPDVLEQELTDLLTGMLAGILRLDSVEVIDKQRPLDEYGMDSLTATELRNKLASRFDVALPIAELIAGRSIVDLSSLLVSHLGHEHSSNGTHRSGSDEADTIEILI